MEIVKYTNGIQNIESLIYSGLSLGTVRGYESDRKEIMTITGKGFNEMTPADLAAYYQFITTHYRAATVNRKLAVLSGLYRKLAVFGAITHNPVETMRAAGKLKSLSVNKAVKPIVTKQEVKAVICGASPQIAEIIRFMGNTGVRISELTGIKQADITSYPEYHEVLIHGKGKKERKVYLSFSDMERIRAAFTKDSPFLFHTRTGKRYGRENLHNQIKAAFIKHTGKAINPHRLRHFFATEKIANEKQDIKAVSRYLGHATTAITLDMYCDTGLDYKNAGINL